MTKKAKVRVRVSIPRAGEFIATIPVEFDVFPSANTPFRRGSIVSQARIEIGRRVKITPEKGEVKRLMKELYPK